MERNYKLFTLPLILVVLVFLVSKYTLVALSYHLFETVWYVSLILLVPMVFKANWIKCIVGVLISIAFTWILCFCYMFLMLDCGPNPLDCSNAGELFAQLRVSLALILLFNFFLFWALLKFKTHRKQS